MENYMADLYAELGGNARRTAPSSEFGTPRLTTVFLDTDGATLPDGETGWAVNDSDADNLLKTGEFQSPNSNVFLAVQAIQQYCEVYQVGGTADSNLFCVAVRDSSIPYDEGTSYLNVGNTITKLQDAVQAALGGAAVLVEVGTFRDDDLDS
jgi:hypothetical protein